MTTLHIVFLGGVTEYHAEKITGLLNRQSAPTGHELSVVSVPAAQPQLLGVVVVNDDSETTFGSDPQPVRDDGIRVLEVGH